MNFYVSKWLYHAIYEGLDMRNVLISVLIVLIGWDVLTTYYGTLTIFIQGSGVNPQKEVIARVLQGDTFIHLVSLIFAIGLIVFILAYRIILNSQNKITMGILGIGFLYDFGTSFYGTLQAAKQFDPTFPVVAIVTLVAAICTSAPLLIGQIIEDSEVE